MSNNFLNQTFNWNIKLPEKTIRQAKETAQNTVSGIWEPLFNFIDENQKVFTGNIANEIEMYNREMFNIGAQLRKGSPTGSLNLRS